MRCFSYIPVVAAAILFCGCHTTKPAPSHPTKPAASTVPETDATRGSIDGFVFGPDGKPVVGADVYARGKDDSPNGRPDQEYVSTDERGYYRMPLFWPTTYSIRVMNAHDEALANTLELNITVVAGRTSRQDFHLVPAARAEGIVKTSEGNPVKNAGVCFQMTDAEGNIFEGDLYGSGMHRLPWFDVETDDSGKFRSHCLPQGLYVISVSPPKNAGLVGCTSAKGMRMEAGKMRTLDYVLPPSASISGTVRDASGAAFPGVDVWMDFVSQPKDNVAEIESWALSPSDPLTTDSSGRFQKSDGLPPGEYRLMAIPPKGKGAASRIETIFVGKGQKVLHDLKLGKSSVLQGKVKTDPMLLRQHKITVLVQIDTGLVRRWSKAGVDGSYILDDGLCPGKYKAYVMDDTEGIFLKRDVPLTINEGEKPTRMDFDVP